MTEKIQIAEGKIQGNLNSKYQHYSINYLPTDREFSAKIELAIMLKKEGFAADEYRSLRFTNLAQIRTFVIGLIRAYFLFAVETGEITSQNFKYRLNKLFDDIKFYLMKTLQ